MLNSEFCSYFLKNNFTKEQGSSLQDKRPKTGKEKYEDMSNLWESKNWKNFGDYLEYYNLQDIISFLSAVCNYAKEMRDNKVDLVRDAISLPGLAKGILHKHIRPKSLYHIDDPYIYSTIHSSEVGGQSIIFTRKNSEKHPFIKGFDANSLSLYCLGEGQFTSRCIVYKNLIGCYFRRQHRKWEKNSHRSGGGPMKRDSKIAEEFLDYFEEREVKPKNEILERQVKIDLSASEKTYAKNEYRKFNIPENIVFSSNIVDSLYTFLPTDITFQGQSSRDKLEGHIVEFNGCYWHACRECFPPNSCYSHRRIKDVDLSAEQVRMIDHVKKTNLERQGYNVQIMRECNWNNIKTESEEIMTYCKKRIKSDPLRVFEEDEYMTTSLQIVEAL